MFDKFDLRLSDPLMNFFLMLVNFQYGGWAVAASCVNHTSFASSSDSFSFIYDTQLDELCLTSFEDRCAVFKDLCTNSFGKRACVDCCLCWKVLGVTRRLTLTAVSGHPDANWKCYVLQNQRGRMFWTYCATFDCCFRTGRRAWTYSWLCPESALAARWTLSLHF